jgi:hypothetical protein
MLLAAERARFVDGYLCIESLVAGIVGGNAPILEYLEIRTFKIPGFYSGRKIQIPLPLPLS